MLVFSGDKIQNAVQFTLNGIREAVTDSGVHAELDDTAELTEGLGRLLGALQIWLEAPSPNVDALTGARRSRPNLRPAIGPERGAQQGYAAKHRRVIER